MEEKIIEYNNSICAHSLPRWEQLPEIELYMDQVISLTNKYLGPYQNDEDALTPSMINNYVKMKALPAPVKKRYSREHLSRLIVICLLKHQLALPTVSAIMEDRIKLFGLEKFYNFFISSAETAFKTAVLYEAEDQPSRMLDLALNATANYTVAKTGVGLLFPIEQEKDKKKK